MATIKSLETEIKRIRQRNNRVEADKAWETSLMRKLLIVILTYVVIVIFFFFAGLPKPFVNSIIPSLAFILSTMTIPFFKKMWLRYFYK